MRNFTRLSIYLFFLLAVTGLYAQEDIVNWKFKTNGIVYSSPLIFNNVVYIGSLDKNFYAIDAKTGNEIWHFKTANKIFSTAAILGDIICFESGNELYGLSLQGDSLWKVTITEGAVTNQYDAWDCFHSSPTIVDSVAYVGSERGQVIGVNINSGEEVFRIDTGDDGVGIRTKPNVYDGKIYFGECSGIFYCYDLTTGLNVWSYDTNPEKLWPDPAILTDIAIKDSLVYFGGRHSILFALNAKTGVREWKHPSPTNQWILGGPAISDSLLFIGSSNQQILHSFNIETRKLRWTTHVDGRIFGVPFIDGDYVFIGTGMEVDDNIGSIYVINKLSGEVINKYAVNKQIHSSLKIEGDAIYFGSRNNYVYSIGKTALINSPYSIINFSSPENIQVGSINNDTTLIVSIRNTGTLADSVKTSFSGRGIPSGAITITPEKFLLPESDSANIAVNINTSQLDTGDKQFFIRITKYNGIERQPITIPKAVSFTYSGATSIFDTGNKYNFNLYQNYPNPFNPETKISYQLKSRSNVQLNIYDITGREVAKLLNQTQNAGEHEITFNAGKLSSGIYIYQIKADNYIQSRKMVILQ